MTNEQKIYLVSTVCCSCLIGILVSSGLQKVLNYQIAKACDPSIYTLVKARNLLGDKTLCVSRVQVYGPSQPLKD
jgi:hypothetical protein